MQNTYCYVYSKIDKYFVFVFFFHFAYNIRSVLLQDSICAGPEVSLIYKRRPLYIYKSCYFNLLMAIKKIKLHIAKLKIFLRDIFLLVYLFYTESIKSKGR